ncbi:citrate synthase, partial [Streptomyces fuscigenes]|uniref:citrate synthase n=1 Tax=Streptomyces fuscigenes TaxID=1528880 RepID=UPI001F35F005
MTDTTGDGGTAGKARLTTREAARRLGVKPETVYAYVSRGQLSSRRDPAGRGSTFDPAEIDALAHRAHRPAPADGDVTRPIETGVTLIGADRYWYRGVDPVELARSHPYEEIADWLWTGTLTPGREFTAPAELLAAARRAVDALPPHSGGTDRLRAAAVAAAVADPLRFDLSPEAVLG